MVSSRLLSSFVHTLCGRCDAKLRLKDLFRKLEGKIILEKEIMSGCKSLIRWSNMIKADISRWSLIALESARIYTSYSMVYHLLFEFQTPNIAFLVF